MIDPGLKGKVVLVTGANHGIGAAMARGFAAQEAQVAVTVLSRAMRVWQRGVGAGQAGRNRRRRALPGRTTARRAGTGGADPRCKVASAIAREVDLGNPANIPLLFDWCEAQLGPVDVLVNNHTYCVLETFDPALVTDVPGRGATVERGADRCSLCRQQPCLCPADGGVLCPLPAARRTPRAVSSTSAPTPRRACRQRQLRGEQARH